MNALVAEHNWTSWIYISEIIFKIFQLEPDHMVYKLYFELGFLFRRLLYGSWFSPAWILFSFLGLS